MTKREQERCDAALSYLKDSKLDLPQVVKASSYFIAGAKWSENAMIEKACEWISKTLYIYTEEIEDKHWNETKTYDWVTSDYDSVSDFIEGFRKAMEE